MKKVLIILALIVLVACPCAQALSISSQVTLIGGVQTATYWVDGYVIRVTGDSYYTYDSSEGRYTFYSNGFYTPGGREVLDYYAPMFVAWYEGDEMYKGYVKTLGAITTAISDDPLVKYVSTEDLLNIGDYVAGIPAFICDAEKVPLLTAPAGKKLFDARIGHCVYVYGDMQEGDEYFHVNYEGYEGYIDADNLMDPGDLSDRFAIVTTSNTVAFSEPDASSIQMGEVAPDTELLCTWEYEKWYECMPYGGRIRYYIPKSSAEKK